MATLLYLNIKNFIAYFFEKVFIGNKKELLYVPTLYVLFDRYQKNIFMVICQKAVFDILKFYKISKIQVLTIVLVMKYYNRQKVNLAFERERNKNNLSHFLGSL